jgi:hypothetical protein
VRRAAAALVLVLVALAAGGCTHRTAKSAAAPSTSSSTTTSSSTSTSSSTTSTTAPAGPSACTARRLALAVAQQTGATGHEQVVMTFTNTSTSPCVLNGYPGVELVDRSGHAVPTNEVRGDGFTMHNTAPPSPVTLAPRAKAWFGFDTDDVCTNSPGAASSAVLVIAPNDRTQLRAALTLQYCPNPTVHVSPVRARESEVTAP